MTITVSNFTASLFSDFPIRLFDVSVFNDRQETDYKPTFEKLAAIGFRGVGIRVGYGIVEDRMFKWYWQKAKGVMDRLPYWYFDFYSHKGTGMTIEDWARIQAGVCHDLLDGDPGEMPLHIDCEASSIAKITVTNASEYARGVKAFIEEYKRLSNSKVSIYCSPGLLWVFGDYFKDCDLWIAWYNKKITWKDIKNKLAQFKWRGVARIWQYASDGDVNNDGIADGLALGMETKFLDLNVFLGSMEDYSKYCGGASDPTYTTLPVEDGPADIATTLTIKKAKVVCTSGLNVRVAPGTASTWKEWIPAGASVEIIQESQDSKGNPWARIGYNQWCAVKYNDQVMIEI